MLIIIFILKFFLCMQIFVINTGEKLKSYTAKKIRQYQGYSKKKSNSKKNRQYQSFTFAYIESYFKIQANCFQIFFLLFYDL